MEKTIYIAYVSKDKNRFKSLKNAFEKRKIAAKTSPEDVNDSDLYAVLFSSGIDKKELFNEYPWIENELGKSSTRHLRVLPLITYESDKKEDPFAMWEEGPSEIYEETFSEEFKPFAFDLSDADTSIDELERVYNLYYSK